MPSRHVVFYHGQEGGPWGRKLTALGYVSLAAASLLHARGLFLLAPVIYSSGLTELRPGVLDCPVSP